MSAPGTRLASLLRPVLETAGADLEDLSVSPAGRRRVVRVVVDRDGGITLDDVAELSRLLSEALDDIEAREPALLGGAYVLEVSSPGVDRPLVLERHWRRNVGRLVKVVLADGTELTGRLRSVDAEAAVLDVEGVERAVTLADVGRALVQVEFGRLGDDAVTAGDPADEQTAEDLDDDDDDLDDDDDDNDDDDDDSHDDDAVADGAAPDREEAP